MGRKPARLGVHVSREGGGVMHVILNYATNKSVRVHVAKKTRMRCLFCRRATVIGSHYVALRGATEDREPCTSYFHVGCFGACVELTESGDNLVDNCGWDEDELVKATPDFYEVAQFLAAYFAHKVAQRNEKKGAA